MSSLEGQKKNAENILTKQLSNDNLRSERLLHSNDSIVIEKMILATEPRMLPRLKKVIVFEDPIK